MKVIQNITGKGPGGETVDVNYYTGDSLAQAISALAMAAASVEDDDKWYTVNGVRLEIR